MSSKQTNRIYTTVIPKVTWFSVAQGWTGMTKGVPSAWIKIISLNSHNLIITSTAAGWTWLFPAEQICFAFRTIWSGQDVIFMMLLLISSQSSCNLFKANLLWGKNNFFRDQKISLSLIIISPQSMVVEKRSPLEEEKTRASDQNLRREQNLPAF